MYQAAVATLAATAQLSGERGLPPTDVLREQMIRSLREFVARCREAAIPDQEIAEARYALVAFIDDRVLRSSLARSSEWGKNPLQHQFYREFTAGENFFSRMRALTHRGGPVLPLEAYYLCLALGFVGALAGAARPDAARPFLEAARARLLSGCNVERIAPSAVPIEGHRPPAKQFPLAVAAAVACALIGTMALVGLNMSLGGVVARTAVELITADAAGVAPTPASR
jgi:type IV/VI secretion system ImpK/VasF family protein